MAARETTVNDVPITLAEATGATGGLREEARRTAEERGRVVLLWTTSGRRKTVVVSVPGGLSDRVSADELLAKVTLRLGGGGGGNARIAQGGVDTSPTAESLIGILASGV
jgi:alanyl-tRNA synthetase